MENEKSMDEHIGSFESVLTDNIKTYWSETRKWALFFAIMALIFTVLMLFGSIAVIAASSAIENTPGMPFSSGMISGMYIVFVLVYILPIYYLFKFNSSSKQAIQNGSIELFEESLNYIKLLFRYGGVLTLVIIALYIIVILLAIAGAGQGLF